MMFDVYWVCNLPKTNIRKIRFGATMQFPEGLEDSPFTKYLSKIYEYFFFSIFLKIMQNPKPKNQNSHYHSMSKEAWKKLKNMLWSVAGLLESQGFGFCVLNFLSIVSDFLSEENWTQKWQESKAEQFAKLQFLNDKIDQKHQFCQIAKVWIL